MEPFDWCVILISQQLLWQNMEAPVSIFQESPQTGETRKRLFRVHKNYNNIQEVLHWS